MEQEEVPYLPQELVSYILKWRGDMMLNHLRHRFVMRGIKCRLWRGRAHKRLHRKGTLRHKLQVIKGNYAELEKTVDEVDQKCGEYKLKYEALKQRWDDVCSVIGGKSLAEALTDQMENNRMIIQANEKLVKRQRELQDERRRCVCGSIQRTRLIVGTHEDAAKGFYSGP